MSVGVMTVGVMSVEDITLGVMTVGVMTVGVMRRPHLHNTMDKTDIVHALNQYVEKLNIVLKTFKKTKNIG